MIASLFRNFSIDIICNKYDNLEDLLLAYGNVYNADLIRKVIKNFDKDDAIISDISNKA